MEEQDDHEMKNWDEERNGETGMNITCLNHRVAKLDKNAGRFELVYTLKLNLQFS